MTQFKVNLRQRNIPEEQLLADLRRVAEQLQTTSLTAMEYTSYGRYGVNTFLLESAEFPPSGSCG
jgi:hypothetical protein